MNRRQDLGLILFLIVILIVLLAHKAGLKRVRDHMPSVAFVFIRVTGSFPSCIVDQCSSRPVCSIRTYNVGANLSHTGIGFGTHHASAARNTGQLLSRWATRTQSVSVHAKPVSQITNPSPVRISQPSGKALHDSGDKGAVQGRGPDVWRLWAHRFA